MRERGGCKPLVDHAYSKRSGRVGSGRVSSFSRIMVRPMTVGPDITSVILFRSNFFQPHNNWIIGGGNFVYV